jgi:carbonic anhydrase
MFENDKPNVNPEPGIVFRFKKDFGAGLSVFFIALPLCLGIALACGAPLSSGLISGILGGLVVGLLSGSATSVSGPAAGMVAVVLATTNELGSFNLFCQALVVAGFIQALFGFLRVGFLSSFIPRNIIQGLLVAIGLILILKQIPHVLGLNEDFLGDFGFIQSNGRNTFSEIAKALSHIHLTSFLLFLLSIITFWLLEKYGDRFIKGIHSSLLIVLLGVILQLTLQFFLPNYSFAPHLLVNIPVFNPDDFKISWPGFNEIFNLKFWKAGLSIALVASLETLLNIKATDKLDGLKRITPPNQELFAQGAGNFFSGLLGGIPITSVVVRSSVNIQSGSISKASTIFHGFLLLGSILFLYPILNLIPICSLATLLIINGYKLAKAEIFVRMFKRGYRKNIPFLVTVLSIIFTDLLTGILFGWIVNGIVGRIEKSSFFSKKDRLAV